jgi:tRNA (guanine-N7-)-methyltransferase
MTLNTPIFEEKVFGRRLSRPLNSEKQDLYDNVLPVLKEPLKGDFWEKDSLSPLCLEIGFGGGEHLSELALQNPNTQYIGAEPFINGVASLLTHIEESSIKNIWIWDDNINKLLDGIPVKGVFDSVYLLFTDPWPKKRHHKRRFLQDSTILRIFDLLKEKGTWFIATDHTDYRQWILDHFDRHTHLFKQLREDIYFRPSAHEWPITRYEEKAKRKGRVCSFMIYQKLKS